MKKAMILAGPGIQGEQEMAAAFQAVSFVTEIHDLSDILASKFTFDQFCKRYAVLAFPGGYSIAGNCSSSQIMALKIRLQLKWDLSLFAQRGGMILGVGTGFKTLIKLNIFGADVSLTRNAQGNFFNEWVKVTPAGQRCLWLKGLGTLDLPVRHDEARLIFGATRRLETMDKMKRLGMLCLHYENKRFQSEENLAGLCDPTGRILGLIPHPESFIRWTSYPDWSFQPNRANTPGQGLSFFENAYQEASRS